MDDRFAVRREIAVELVGSKSLAVELDRLRYAAYHQVRRDGVELLGDGIDLGHRDSGSVLGIEQASLPRDQNEILEGPISQYLPWRRDRGKTCAAGAISLRRFAAFACPCPPSSTSVSAPDSIRDLQRAK